MGSIAAVLTRRKAPDLEVVRRMLAAAPHRGHLIRLATLGQAALGAASGDGIGTADVAADPQLAAAFCGSFDNLEEVAAQVEKGGGRIEERSAAEVLKAAFRLYREDACPMIRGVFAGVVTDGTQIWAFRDQVGFAPLFYRLDPRGVYVGTEVKQVVAGSAISSEPDLEVIEQGFYGQVDERCRCAIKGILRLPPATLLRAGDSQSDTRRYWDPESLLETARLSEEDLVTRFDQLMGQALGRALLGQDVLSLSGGIDSPALAAYAAPIYLERTGEPLPCLSTVYPKYPSVDESHYIMAVAEHFNLPLRTYEGQARATDRLVDWVRQFDGPVPVVSLSEMHEHLAQARKLGFRNMLSGEFAEYVFDLRSELVPHLFARGRIGAALHHMRLNRSRRVSASALFRQGVRAFVPVSMRSVVRKLRGRPEPKPAAPAWIDSRKISPLNSSSGSRWREDQLAAFRGPSPSLEANELIQALTGVSVRRPWADLDLWEFFLSLPAEVKFPDGRRKSLVRRMLKGKVPDLILDRTDKTFFDESIVARIDYGALRGWLLRPEYRVDGIDYDKLGELLQSEDMTLLDFMWAKDLAGVHAFLSLW